MCSYSNRSPLAKHAFWNRLWHQMCKYSDVCLLTGIHVVNVWLLKTNVTTTTVFYPSKTKAWIWNALHSNSTEISPLCTLMLHHILIWDTTPVHFKVNHHIFWCNFKLGSWYKANMTFKKFLEFTLMLTHWYGKNISNSLYTTGISW